MELLKNKREATWRLFAENYSIPEDVARYGVVGFKACV